MIRDFYVFLLSFAILFCADCSQSKKELLFNDLVGKSVWKGKPGNTTVMKKHTIKTITIHHEGVLDDGTKSAAEKMRNLQIFSMEQKRWGDVPYHYVIDLAGNIYAGRDVAYAGDTNTEYDPSGHLLICVHGNFEEQSVPESAYHALVKFTAKQALLYQVPIDSIKTHKDYVSSTLCPGKNLYHYFETGQFYRDVKAEIKPEQK